MNLVRCTSDSGWIGWPLFEGGGVFVFGVCYFVCVYEIDGGTWRRFEGNGVH
jgi:hypothetical protein